MKKIVHIISNLNQGGAEMMLYKLMIYLDKDEYQVEVVSMLDKGILGDKIEALGIKVHTLNMKRGFPSLKAIKKGREICRDADIIQSWMYHADFLSYIIRKLQRNKINLIWGIHQSNLDKDKNKRMTRAIAKINAMLSRKIDVIVSCSIKAKVSHVEYGYNEDKIRIIPNGFDLNDFHNINQAKECILKEINCEHNKYLLGTVGRWDIQKDYYTFIEAMGMVKKQNNNIHIIMCGTNLDNNNQELVNLIKEHNLDDNISLLGRREDIPLIMSALDIYISSSSGEAFPNVLGEAMACETPCVVTNAGDCKYIVGDTGLVSEVKDAKGLAKNVLSLLNMGSSERYQLGHNARQRIINNFDIIKIAKQYENIYDSF